MTILQKVAALSLAMNLAACSGVSTEAQRVAGAPLVGSVAPRDDADTFARVRWADGRVVTLLVTGFDRHGVRAVDLTAFGAPLDADVFDVIAALGTSALDKARRANADHVYALGELLPSAGSPTRQLATGTNFRAHARETEIEEVFNFPKFGPATPSRTTVALRSGVLLDYEVEICARFDRDIRTVADFDAARKGFFLCGDFTDRASLMRLVDPKNLASGKGFSDAKSEADFFPTGPFLVVPRDWRAFVRSQRMTTRVNEELRQDARGGEMILDFRAIVQKALTNGGGGSYTFKGAAIPLLSGGTISRGSAVMSGTADGVVFRPPQLSDYVSGGRRYIFTGPMFRGDSAQRVMIEGFIEKERRSGRYLKPGDLVAHSSSSMGDLQVEVIGRTPRTVTAAASARADGEGPGG